MIIQKKEVRKVRRTLSYRDDEMTQTIRHKRSIGELHS